jgi:hypothetical protein
MDEFLKGVELYTTKSIFEYRPISVVIGSPQFGERFEITSSSRTEIMLEPTTNNLNDDSTKTSTS